MKTLLKIGIALALFGAISGCVYDPGYGYVRQDGYYGGSAYYGARYGYSPYAYDYEYSPGYYGYGYAYPSIGIGLNYYDRGYRHHGNWDGRGRDHGRDHGHRDNGGHRH